MLWMEVENIRCSMYITTCYAMIRQACVTLAMVVLSALRRHLSRLVDVSSSIQHDDNQFCPQLIRIDLFDNVISLSSSLLPMKNKKGEVSYKHQVSAASRCFDVVMIQC